MHYLIQSNIQYDPEHDKIWDVLDELQLSYEPIELNGQTDLDAVRTERKDIFVYGSVKLARLAKERSDWNPGSFYGGNHLFKAHAPYYKDHLLNIRSQKRLKRPPVCIHRRSALRTPFDTGSPKDYFQLIN